MIASMNKTLIFFAVCMGIGLSNCKNKKENTSQPVDHSKIEVDSTIKSPDDKVAGDNKKGFSYFAEQFADVKVLRYQVPGFEKLAPKQKELLYYLYEAALAGRDIFWDQNYKYNLVIRRTLEAVYKNGKPPTNSATWDQFVVYLKRVWFSNGIHHHYSNEKFKPEFNRGEFIKWLAAVPKENLPQVDGVAETVTEHIFNMALGAKKVNLDSKSDLIKSSATNYYDNSLTQKQVEKFYKGKIDKKSKTPISYGLNSKLVYEDGIIKERVWKLGGMYGQAIEKIVHWLNKAIVVAENPKQQKALELLVEFYKTGDLATFDAYSIAWVEDVNSRIDVVNGFIEVYGDPMGYRGAFESVVSIRDLEASKRISAIGKEAQWFENNSPIMEQHKKENVKGISAKVITVVMESGDSSPTTPIGINLPNSNWIRSNHGSKSVNLGNIVHAYEESGKSSGITEEFSFDKEEVARAKKGASVGDVLHTDMHEVIGHASGKINEGVGSPKETLKNYSSTLEEGRADLVALYFMMDSKLVELGVMSDLEVGKAAYDDYIRQGLMIQLARLELGAKIEEAHMRNRQMIAKWVLEKGKEKNVVEKKTRDGKTFFVINDYKALRELFGKLLREVQRIKSEGDYISGKNLVETYGVEVDTELHKEVKERYASLKVAPYSGFINPRLEPVFKEDSVVDVKVNYPSDFAQQMVEYGEKYSTLPDFN